MIAGALILALTLSCAHGRKLEKKQQSDCDDESSEVDRCTQQALSGGKIDCDCISVLTDYYECMGFDYVEITTDEDCSAAVTMGATLFSIISALAVAVAAAFN